MFKLQIENKKSNYILALYTMPRRRLLPRNMEKFPLKLYELSQALAWIRNEGPRPYWIDSIPDIKQEPYANIVFID